MSEQKHRAADRPGELFGFRVLELGGGKARVAVTVGPDNSNYVGTLHGGVIATMIDNAGTLAIMTADRDGRPGVTTDLNVSYLAPGPAGAEVIAEAQVLRSGKTLATVVVDLRRQTDGKLVAQGRMTKFLG